MSYYLKVIMTMKFEEEKVIEYAFHENNRIAIKTLCKDDTRFRYEISTTGI
jgi:hypothetical protein